MSIRILGPVEVYAGERPVPIGGRLQLKLFAFLILHANRAVSSDELLHAVWGPARPSGNNRLQMAVARLRKVLQPLSLGGECVVRTVGGGYLGSVPPGEVDAQAFAEGVEQGRRALDVGDPAGAVEVAGDRPRSVAGPAVSGGCV